MYLHVSIHTISCNPLGMTIPYFSRHWPNCCQTWNKVISIILFDLYPSIAKFNFYYSRNCEWNTANNCEPLIQCIAEVAAACSGAMSSSLVSDQQQPPPAHTASPVHATSFPHGPPDRASTAQHRRVLPKSLCPWLGVIRMLLLQ